MNAIDRTSIQEQQYNLPKGWVRTTVGTIFTVVGGGTPSTARADYWDGSIPWITSADIDDGGRISPRKNLTEKGVAESATNRVPPESVIVVTRVGLGKAGLAHEELCFSQDCHGLVFSDNHCFPPFVAYQMRFLVSIFKQISRGTTISGVTKKQLLDLGFKLPPYREQHRIVAEIETQFTRLDAVVTALKRVQANLKRYRASVLQTACEGRLVPTEAELARAEGRTYEPVDQLLQRILQERRAKWESEQLVTIKRESKVSKDDRWKSIYKEPVEPDTSDLSAVPEGWVVASMDQLTTNITSGSRDWSKYYGQGHGTFLMAQNIRPGKLDLTFRQLVDPPNGDRDRIRSQVRCDDLLVTIVGANTGDVCRVPQELPEHFVCQSVALMRPVEQDFSPFLTLYMTSERNGQRQYRRYIYGAGRPHLNFDQLKMTAVLLPPPSEQSRIVSEVERRLSFIDELEATIDANLKRADRLRQALLKRAFEGKLLPQDPTDEPASVLLERIRAEREQAVEKPRATSQKTNFRKHPVQPKATAPVQGELALRCRE